MSDDNSRPPLNRPAAHLLNELESIKGLLADDGEEGLPADIPLLDDMVIDHLDDNAALFGNNSPRGNNHLLNIEHIFGEDAAVEETAPSAAPMQFPRFTLDVAISDDSEISSKNSYAAPPSPPPQRVRPDYSREVLIQELVDEFIPQIEAELHRRLRQLDDSALRHLKDPK